MNMRRGDGPALPRPWRIRLHRHAAALAAGMLVLWLLAVPPAHAEDGWRVQATPYVWMSGLEGQVRPFARAPLVTLDKSFSEVLDNLDAAAFLTATARRERFVLQADVTQARSSDSAPLPIGLDAGLTLRQRSASVTAGYSRPATDQATLDLMAGVRHWDIHAAVAVPGLLAARSDSTFVDPIVALRWHQALSARWSSVAYADWGGFGVGSDSTWQLLALANYQASKRVYLSAGYRHQQLDYRDAGKRIDVALSGPMLGLTWRWGNTAGHNQP